MTLAQIKLESAKAELELAILIGNAEREFLLRLRILELQAQVEREDGE